MSKIKKALLPLHTALTALHTANANCSLNQALSDPAILKLFEAGKGGFSGENSFVEIDGNRVARECAMTGAVFAHDNTDKTASFFYKNGSYMIGAEIVKANARKVWEVDQEAQAITLEDAMLDLVITPKEWKEQATALKANTFEFHLDDATKASLIADYDGYATKEDFITAYNDGAVPAFTDYEDVTQSLRDAGKPAKEEEPTEEA